MHHDILRFCNYFIELQAESQTAITQKFKLFGNNDCWPLFLA